MCEGESFALWLEQQLGSTFTRSQSPVAAADWLQARVQKIINPSLIMSDNQTWLAGCLVRPDTGGGSAGSLGTG